MIRTVVLAVLMATGPVHAAATFPREWFVLPEDPAPASSSSRSSTDWKGLERKVEKLIRFHSTALDDVQVNNEDWYLSAFILDLSLSLGGTLGVLAAEGKASANLYFRPQTAIRSDEDALENAVEVPAHLSREQLPKFLEPVMRAVLATGEVKDEGRFRRNLTEVVTTFHDWRGLMAFQPSREWVVSKLRLDVGVDASGTVHPSLTVGGGLRLRFDWDIPRQPSRRRSKNLEGLLAAIARSMEKVPVGDQSPAGFSLGSIKLALGLFGKAKFGVVKGSASIVGHVYLKRARVVNPVFTEYPEPASSIPVIVDNPSERIMRFAHGRGLRAQVSADNRAAFEIPVSAFENGMKKAARIGAFLAERASRGKGNRWDPYQLKTEFALSLSGTVGVVTLGGQGSIQLAYKK